MELSTCDAEYVAASTAARHTGWMRRLLAQMTNETLKNVPLAMENQGALAIARKSAPTKHSKYIDVRHHLIRDMTARKLIAPYFMRSANLTADVMTKPLTPATYRHYCQNLSIQIIR